MPPHENLGPPLEAEGAPAESGTPTDHSNVNSNFIKQYCNATLGRWSPLTWALSYAAAGHLVIPLEHGRNIPPQTASRQRLERQGWDGWSPRVRCRVGLASCIRSAERYVGPEAEKSRSAVDRVT